MKLKNKVIIIIPVFNVQELVIDALSSVLKQDFDDLGIIIRDDLSTDNTCSSIASLLHIDGIDKCYVKLFGKDVLFIRNNMKLYGGGNTYDSVRKYVSNKESVIGVVDGDDKLIDDAAVSKIYEVYKKSDVWLVWSQHRLQSGQGEEKIGCSCPLPPDETIYQTRNYWSVSHFRTCKAWLFHKINPEDLVDPFEGMLYCRVAADAAFIYPIIELCGNDKSYFLDELLYCYNDILPHNDHNISLADVNKYSVYIRNKQRYSPINHTDLNPPLSISYL